MYKVLIKRVLFLFSPETAHTLVFKFLSFLFLIPGIPVLFRLLFSTQKKGNSRHILGMDFPNPVGLAAGFDKNARHIDILAAMGFGFVEIGTVTPLPQAGNPQPRLFRLTQDHALLNRMGFNNDGADVIAKRLKNRLSGIIVGANIGKNKVTPNEEAVLDYEKCFIKLAPFVDYFAVNVSSPNTPGLRSLQEKGPLSEILNRLMVLNRSLAAPKPILLKIAPDLTNEQLLDIVSIVIDTQISGVIATNTTLSRKGLKTPVSVLEQLGAGGLSGLPVKERSTEVVDFLKKHSQGKFTIVGVGGIHSEDDALEKFKAGADLIQLYTGWIYEGPMLVRRILSNL